MADAADAGRVPSRQCLILIGGLGTRLGELTRAVPKPLLEVAGRPFLDHLLDSLIRHGFDHIVLLAGYRAEVVLDRYGHPGQRVRVDCLVEPQPAGTGGALLQARDVLAGEFLLLNGDSIFDINLLDLAVGAVGQGGPVGRVALRRVEDASRYGAVRLEGGRITAFAERPEAPGPGLINGGIYWLSRDILADIGRAAAGTGACSIERDVMPGLAAAGRLEGRVYDGGFIDIGIPDDFARAQELLPAWQRRPAVFLAGEAAAEDIKRFNDQGLYVFAVAGAAGGDRRGPDDALRRCGAHIDDVAKGPASDGIPALLGRWPVDPAHSRLHGGTADDRLAATAAGLSGG